MLMGEESPLPRQKRHEKSDYDGGVDYKSVYKVFI